MKCKDEVHLDRRIMISKEILCMFSLCFRLTVNQTGRKCYSIHENFNKVFSNSHHFKSIFQYHTRPTVPCKNKFDDLALLFNYSFLFPSIISKAKSKMSKYDLLSSHSALLIFLGFSLCLHN